MAVASCGGDTDSSSGDPAKPVSRIVNLGGTTVPDTPGEAVWLAFEREAESASGGGLDMRPLIYGQLGSEEQLLSGFDRHVVPRDRYSSWTSS